GGAASASRRSRGGRRARSRSRRRAPNGAGASRRAGAAPGSSGGAAARCGSRAQAHRRRSRARRGSRPTSARTASRRRAGAPARARPPWAETARSSRARRENASCLVQPGLEHVFDLAAPARVLEATLHAPVGDDEQRRYLLDAEALDEIGSLVDVDLVEDEGAVVLAPLEDLRDEALDAPAPSAELRVEEDEPRPSGCALLDGYSSLGQFDPLHSAFEPSGALRATVDPWCTRAMRLLTAARLRADAQGGGDGARCGDAARERLADDVGGGGRRPQRHRLHRRVRPERVSRARRRRG